MVELEMTLGEFPTTKQEVIKEAEKRSILVRARLLTWLCFALVASTSVCL